MSTTTEQAKHTGSQDYAAYTEDRCSNEDACPRCTPDAQRVTVTVVIEGTRDENSRALAVLLQRYTVETITGDATSTQVQVATGADEAGLLDQWWTADACEQCGAEPGEPCRYACIARPTVI